MFQLNTKAPVMPVGKRASSAMDGKLRAIHVVWISAIPAEMTRSAREKVLELRHLYNQVLISVSCIVLRTFPAYELNSFGIKNRNS
jgi:hypothetical protein